MGKDRDMTDTWARTGTQYLKPQTKARSSSLKAFHATVLKLQNSAVKLALGAVGVQLQSFLSSALECG